MSQRRLTGLQAAAAIGAILFLSPSLAQSGTDVSGVWRIAEVKNYGPGAKGILILTPDKRYSLILVRGDLPKYVSGQRNKATAEEYKATVDGSIAYFGTYTVEEDNLKLNVEGSTFPNWTGTTQVRSNLKVTGDELRYTVLAPSGGGASDTLVWKRAN
jgi:hypothetical protein